MRITSPTVWQVWTAVALPLACLGCGASQARSTDLFPAGANEDDGTGQLAKASVKLREPVDVEPGGFLGGNPVDDSERYGGFVYGGSGYGGSTYGGDSRVDPTPIDRSAAYTLASIADAGAIVGKVSWPRPPTAPGRLTTACGEIANPSLVLGAGGTVGGAIVYLARIERGKPPASLSSTVSQGGVVFKQGCVLYPRAQVVGPVPARLRIATDDAGATLTARRASFEPDADGKPVVVTRAFTLRGLQEAAMAAEVGITQISADDGTLLPATLVATSHPYITMTAVDGSFRLDDVLPGTYQLVVWHAPVATGVKAGVITLTTPTTTTRTVVVTANNATRADVSL